MQLLIGNILNYLLMKIKRSEQKTVIQQSGHLEFLMRRWVAKQPKKYLRKNYRENSISKQKNVSTKMSKRR